MRLPTIVSCVNAKRLLENYVVSKAEMAPNVPEIQSEIRENVVSSCRKRAGFNLESTVGLVDLPKIERLVLSCN